MRRGTIILIVVALLLLAAAGGGAYYYFVIGPGQQEATTDEEAPMNGGEGTDQDTAESRPDPRPREDSDEVAQQEGTPSPEPEIREVVVASTTVAPGTLVENPNDFFEIDEFPADDPALLGIDPVTDLGEIRGKVINTTIPIGDPVDRSYLDRPGLAQEIPAAEDGETRNKAYVLQVDRYSGVADLVRVGDYVDVMVTMQFRGAGQPQPADYRQRATKAIIQQVQVLRILRPPPPPPEEGEEPAPVEQPPANTGAPPPGAESGATAPGAAAPEEDYIPGDQSTWFLVLAVTAQEAEYLEFVETIRSSQTWNTATSDPNANITLILRGAGDTNFESTQGATIDLLISELGLPLPAELP